MIDGLGKRQMGRTKPNERWQKWAVCGRKKKEIGKERQELILTDRKVDRTIEDNETVKEAKRAGQSDKKRYTYADIKTE